MDKIQSIEQIRDLIGNVRNLRKGFITNFYLNESKHSIWIEDESFYVYETAECVFFLKKNDNFYNLFFSATSIETLCNSLKNAPFNENLISLDVVGAKDNPVKDALLTAGYHVYETMYRMSRIGVPQPNDFDADIEEADMNDIPEIKVILDSNFNALSEQICCEKELALFVNNHTLLVYRDKGIIRGFIIYELQGISLYLRYWWVDELCRNRGIGAKLYRSFFYRGKNSKRQIHWIIATNDNARVRYEHYGYKAETLYDYVLVNKMVL